MKNSLICQNVHFLQFRKNVRIENNFYTLQYSNKNHNIHTLIYFKYVYNVYIHKIHQRPPMIPATVIQIAFK